MPDDAPPPDTPPPAASAGPDSPAPPDAVEKPKHRAWWRRRAVVFGVAAALLVGADAWGIASIEGWETRSAALEDDAARLGDELAEIRGVLESQDDELALLGDQAEAAAAWADELALDAGDEQAVTQALRDAAVALRECSTARAKVIDAYWAGTGTAASKAAADQKCSAAKTAFNRAKAAAS